VRILRRNHYTGIIIGVTGNALQEDVDDFMAEGLNRLVLKPLKREVLMKTLASVGLT
jgi:CheY-like chemotaxis protein